MLEYLVCDDNFIEELDVRQNYNLRKLNCKSNLLNKLYITKIQHTTLQMVEDNAEFNGDDIVCISKNTNIIVDEDGSGDNNKDDTPSGGNNLGSGGRKPLGGG